ncbi:RidA family protein [Bacteroidota bacterium]
MKLKTILWMLLLVFIVSCQTKTNQELEYLNPEGSTNRPFSEAVRVGNLIYTSGNLGRNPETGKFEGISSETKYCLENIKAVLEKNGSSMNQVVKVTVMLADINEWGAMNDVYTTFFSDNKPARSAFGGNGLAAGARVEIECIAYVK